MLTLLYDKTFPPRSQSQANKPLANMQGTTQTESMRQFNYFNRMQQEDPDYDENDVQMLEKEIDNVIRCGTATN